MVLIIDKNLGEQTSEHSSIDLKAYLEKRDQIEDDSDDEEDDDEEDDSDDEEEEIAKKKK